MLLLAVVGRWQASTVVWRLLVLSYRHLLGACFIVDRINASIRLFISNEHPCPLELFVG
jgi:hypothetical protein